MTALLSDLDGVLVDSTASVLRAWHWWAAREGLDASAVERVAHGRPSHEVIAQVAPALDAAAHAAEFERFQAEDTGDVVALPGARELLADTRAVAVVTSGTLPLATARLTAAGLLRPAVLVTPERLARGKPDPEGYLLAARELGAAPADCVVFEDAPAGIAAGRAAGMRVVAVVTTHAAEQLTGADELVASLAEWLARAPNGCGP